MYLLPRYDRIILRVLLNVFNSNKIIHLNVVPTKLGRK